jgi:hypothetical protein
MLKGYTIDFRSFSPAATAQDIYIRQIDTTAIALKIG